jgi:NDP-sugar pyrophosphorylase family protein
MAIINQKEKMMQALLLAAGLGTRLKPLTLTKPKALVEVAGKPLLAHTLGVLERYGADRVVVNVHHHAEQIKDYLSGYASKAEILISDESGQLLETGGALRKAQNLFDADRPILIHNVDIMSTADLGAFYAEASKHDALLMVSARETQRYLLFDEQQRLVGWTNLATGEVRSPYERLDVDRCTKLAFAGIHACSPRLFPMMEDFPERFSIIDFYLKVCRDVVIKAYCPEQLELLDVGKLETLAEAERFVAKNIG